MEGSMMILLRDIPVLRLGTLVVPIVGIDLDMEVVVLCVYTLSVCSFLGHGLLREWEPMVVLELGS